MTDVTEVQIQDFLATQHIGINWGKLAPGDNSTPIEYSYIVRNIQSKLIDVIESVNTQKFVDYFFLMQKEIATDERYKDTFTDTHTPQKMLDAWTPDAILKLTKDKTINQTWDLIAEKSGPITKLMVSKYRSLAFDAVELDPIVIKSRANMPPVPPEPDDNVWKDAARCAVIAAIVAVRENKNPVPAAQNAWDDFMNTNANNIVKIAKLYLS